jgi:hypothetical protein
LAEKSKSRQYPRYEHQSLITREDIKTGIYSGARMFNYSKEGLYFEANYILEPGDEIFIGIENSPYTSASGVYECYRAVVKWSKKINDKDSAYYYGYGVQYYYPDQIFLTPIHGNTDKPTSQLEDLIEESYTREYARKHWVKKIIFSTQNQFYEGLIKNVSRKGAFIETRDAFFKGQKLNLALPLANGKKGIRLRGEVIWTNQDGFGCEFKSRI